MNAGKTVEFADTAKARSPRGPRVISARRLRMIEAALRQLGFGDEIDNAERRTAPDNAEAFACEVVYVIINSGMRWSLAGPIYEACVKALLEGSSASSVFGHAGKAGAIDAVWRDRESLFAELPEPLTSLASAPLCRLSGQ